MRVVRRIEKRGRGQAVRDDFLQAAGRQNLPNLPDKFAVRAVPALRCAANRQGFRDIFVAVNSPDFLN